MTIPLSSFDGIRFESCTILSGATVSSAIITNGRSVSAIELPASITSSLVGVQGSIDGGITFKNIVAGSAGTFALTVTADSTIALNTIQQSMISGFDQIKIFGSATEAAARTIKVKCV